MRSFSDEFRIFSLLMPNSTFSAGCRYLGSSFVHAKEEHTNLYSDFNMHKIKPIYILFFCLETKEPKIQGFIKIPEIILRFTAKK